MVRMLKATVIAVSIGVLAISGTSYAAIYTLRVTGSASGYDITDMFGLGSTINNAAFVDTFTINDSVSGSYALNDPSSQITGITNNYSAPVVTSVLSVNGHSVNYGYPDSDTTTASKQLSGDTATYIAVDVDSTSMIDFISNGVTIASSSLPFGSNFDYLSPFSLPSLAGTGSYGSADYGYYDDFLPSGEYYQGPAAYLNFSLASANLIKNSPAVPEPEGWAMAIAGIGVVGGVARYRRQATQA